MKLIKIITAILVISILVPNLNAGKRAKRKDLEELSNPKSPSYVPAPYPKNRKEIIENIKYYTETFCGESDTYTYSGVDGQKIPINDQVLLDLFASKSPYKIGKILKVRNYFAAYPDEYSWVILVLEKNGGIIMRIAMRESGLLIGNDVILEENLRNVPESTRKKMERARKFKDADEVIRLFSQKMQRKLAKENFKKFELVAFPCRMADLPFPLWEIELDGITYYYSELEDVFYTVERKVTWKRDNESSPRSPREMASHGNFLIDTVNDQIIVLQPLIAK